MGEPFGVRKLAASGRDCTCGQQQVAIAPAEIRENVECRRRDHRMAAASAQGSGLFAEHTCEKWSFFMTISRACSQLSQPDESASEMNEGQE